MSTTKIAQRRAKNPTVVARNPKLSTDIPAKVGPKKLPKQNDVDHMAIEKIWYFHYDLKKTTRSTTMYKKYHGGF